MSLTDNQSIEVFASKKQSKDFNGILEIESENELDLGSPEGCSHLKNQEQSENNIDKYLVQVVRDEISRII